jgi:signal-transduction protein with cAMP-binding, CBS, and nucleotidyltransferase domain
MRTNHCRSVVVVGLGGGPIAMLTDRDVCLTGLRTGRDLAALLVAQAMSRALHTCRATDPLQQVAETMALHQAHRLPVLDARGGLVGVVSLDDLAHAARTRRGPFAAPAHGTDGIESPTICPPRLVVGGGDPARRLPSGTTGRIVPP